MCRQRKYVDSIFQFKTFGKKVFDRQGRWFPNGGRGLVAVFNQSSRQLNSPTQHSDDSSLGIEAPIRIVGSPRQRLQQATPLQLHTNEHVEHTNRCHGSTKEDKSGDGEHMGIKVVLHLGDKSGIAHSFWTQLLFKLGSTHRAGVALVLVHHRELHGLGQGQKEGSQPNGEYKFNGPRQF